MKTDQTAEYAATVTWTRPMLNRFKRNYHEAVENKADSFFFDGHEFVTDYAKYLIEYLEQKLAP